VDDPSASGGDLFEPFPAEDLLGGTDRPASVLPEEPVSAPAPQIPDARRHLRFAALSRVIGKIAHEPAVAQVPVDPVVPPATRHLPWRRISLALSLALAGLLTLNGFLAAERVAGSGPTPSPRSAAAATASRGSKPTPATTAAATASAYPAATPRPRPTATSPIAVVTFRDLVVDSPTANAATVRTFTFSTDGPGPVSIGVVATSPMDSSRICYTMDSDAPVCASGATPGFDPLDATTAHSLWTVTLVSAGRTSPIVDVRFSWPTDHASMTLAHGRFQGGPNPDSLRNLTATFTTRGAGDIGLAASWPPVFTNAVLSLTDLNRRDSRPVDTATYNSTTWISPGYSYRAAAQTNYQLVLTNAGADAGRPDLTATVSFP
jgi:hypothetical protein